MRRLGLLEGAGEVLAGRRACASDHVLTGKTKHRVTWADVRALALALALEVHARQVTLEFERRDIV